MKPNKFKTNKLTTAASQDQSPKPQQEYVFSNLPISGIQANGNEAHQIKNKQVDNSSLYQTKPKTTRLQKRVSCGMALMASTMWHEKCCNTVLQIGAPTAVAQALLQQQQQRPREAAAALKVELKDFSSRQEDWEDWRIEHLAKAEAFGFAQELTTHEGRDIMVGAEGLDASGVDSVRLRQAGQAWTSLITTCKGSARDLVKSAESPGGAWRLLNQHYRASGLKEKRRLAEEFNSMKMEIGERPRSSS